jgi:hypothetical protein
MSCWVAIDGTPPCEPGTGPIQAILIVPQPTSTLNRGIVCSRSKLAVDAVIRPCVVSNRPMSTIGPCLQAISESELRDQALIVLSGLDPALATRRSQEIHQLLPGAEIVCEPSPGANRARNRALAEAMPDEVLAFIDDDAVIGTSWVVAMSKAWSAARPEVGAIGGPVRPRFLARRPDWMTEFTLSALSIVDRGRVPRRLDPEREPLYSANLAFRVRHARAVSGFDPSLGPSGALTGFGDDIDIQRRMGLAGIEIWYAPDAWVEHLIGAERLTRRVTLNRRFQAGVDLGRLSSRPLLEVIRECVTSTALGVVAEASGRSGTSMDRWSYSAQCVGELRTRVARLGCR